jgi:DNA-directed RNA polymerase subunit RPC12/RpoP
MRRRLAQWMRPRPFWMTTLIVLGVASALAIAAFLTPWPRSESEAPQPGATLTAELYQDFRLGQPLLPPLDFFGPEAAARTNLEKGGIRVTLPADRHAKDPVGVLMTTPLPGDFELTASYEIVEAKRPKAGYGVGFEFYITTDTPSEEALAFYRMSRVAEGDVFLLNRMTTVDAKRRYNQKVVITHDPTRSGQLRLTRTGTQLTCAATDGGADFRELGAFDLGPEPLKYVRVAGFTGNAPESVEVRLLDLRVRASSPFQGANSGYGTFAGGWLAGSVVLAIVCCVLLTLGLRLQARRHHRALLSPAAAAVATAVLTFSCASCGKGLKAKTELAGRKVKCPYCGAGVLVAERKSALA